MTLAPEAALRARRQARWLDGSRPWRGYAFALASMAAVDLALSGLFVTLAGRPAAILLRLPEIAVILLGLNLCGGWLLFRPVARWLDGRGPAEAALARLARLTAWTGWWAVAVAAVFAVSSFLVMPFAVYGLAPTPETLAILFARALAWSVLLPYVAYFLAADHVRRLRRLIFARHGLSAAVGAQTLGAKLALIVAGGALAPGASIAVTLALVPPVSPITGQPRELIIVVTLIGAGLALAVAFWAMRRSLDSSLGALMSGMAEIGAGGRQTRLAVQTDDELGRLADGFNALAAALGESEAQAARAESDRARAASQFHEAQKHAALGRMAGGVAHDFNNILAIMMGYADVARRRLPEGDANARRMAEIVKAAERGKALIAQILAFTRARPPEHARLDLRASVAETAEWLQASIGRGVALELALPDAPLWIMGDATGAHQVVANLCVNAAHAMRGRAGAVSVTLDRLTIDGGRAEGLRASGLRDKVGAEGPAVVLDESRADRLRAHVGLLRPGPHARVTVRDAGTGMAPEVFRHVFDPYFTTKPVGEGTGLGLAAVLGIVTQHDGAITLETAPGAGTMFAIFFPLTD